jgi:effector-binding domain-containing protein
MLNLKKAQLEQTIQADIQRLQAVESRLRSLEGGPGLQGVIIKSLPPTPMLSVRKILAESCDGFSLLESARRVLPEHTPGTTYLAAIMYDDDYRETDVDTEIGYFLESKSAAPVELPGGERAEVHVLPAVPKAAAVIRRGIPEAGYDIYDALGRWIEENGYRIAGPSREIFLTPPRPGQEHEMVTEVQWPVELKAAG